MRKGVSRTRRAVAAVAVSMVALLATGTGANAAAPNLSVKNYFARSNASVLDVSLALPEALNSVLGAINIKNPIQQSIAFSRAIAQVDKLGDKGHGLGQMFEGTLNETLETVTKTLLGKTLPKAFAPLALVEKVVHEDLASVDLDLVKVGVSNVNASSTLKKVANGVRAIKSVSDSELLGVTVQLGADLVNTLKTVLAPVLEITDAPGSGLVDTLNGLLQPVEELAEQTLGVPLSLDLPKIVELLDQPLLHIGKIQTRTVTDYVGSTVRNASGFSRMEDISLFGIGQNALVQIEALETNTFAQVGEKASDAKANAVHKIVGLRVLDNEIGLIKGDKLALEINGKELALTDLAGINVDEVLDTVNGLLFDTLGLKITTFGTEKSATASKSFAKARTLEVKLAPNIAGNVLFDLTIAGPGSEALAQGTSILPTTFNPDAPPKTGVSTSLYLLAGPALIGMAVLVRRFALAK